MPVVLGIVCEENVKYLIKNRPVCKLNVHL